MKVWPHLRILLTCMLSLCGASCASVQTVLPVISAAEMKAETQKQEITAFTRIQSMQARLDAISADILSANSEACEKTRLDPGVLMHSEKTYPKSMREAAARQNGASKYPAVLVVRDGSPAHKAGLKIGDHILDSKSRPAGITHKDVQAGLERGRLQILRGDEDISLEIGDMQTVCDYPVRLRISGAVNAYATGKSIIVTTGMMDFARADNELALIVGHELAHNTMSHIRKSIQNFILSGFAHRTTRPFEAEADYVGLYYMAKAGYETGGAEDFWYRLGVRSPKSIYKAKTHPVTPQRLLAIRRASAEIKAKAESGAALEPEYILGKAPKTP